LTSLLSQVRKKNKTTRTNSIDRNRLLPIGRKIERIVPTKNKSEQTLPISKRNLAGNPTIKKEKENFLLANIAADPRVKNGVRIKRIHTKSVVTKMIIHLRCSTSTLTWAKLPEKIRVTDSKVISNHQRQHPLRLLLIIFANVTFAIIPIIWQTPAHRRESINRMLKISFMQIKSFWLYSSHLFLHRISKHVLRA
jgi:hypothetical protein